ncbi:unnamed protein product [Urochloa humidicola]
MYPAKPTSEPPPSATGIPVMGTPVPAAGIAAAPGNAAAANRWTYGLFTCCGDYGVCCLTCWCPCVTFGRVAETVDRGGTSCLAAGAVYELLACLTGCHWIYSCTYRSKLRDQFGIPESTCCDCCVHFCCEPCALCQHYRELKARGFDPALGWDRNAQRLAGAQQAAAAMYAPAAQGMMGR